MYSNLDGSSNASKKKRMKERKDWWMLNEASKRTHDLDFFGNYFYLEEKIIVWHTYKELNKWNIYIKFNSNF